MKIRPVRFALVFCMIFLAFFSWKHRWVGDDGYGWEATVDGDAKGYYAPLPALFLFHDCSFEFFSKPGNESISRYYNPRFRVQTEQGFVNKNYNGVAVMQLPFFAAGHLLAIIAGEPRTGYSWPYMLMLLTGSIAYCIAGLYLMTRLTGSFGITETVNAIMVLMIALGTNLLYYTTIHAAMPHVYSFFLIALFSWSMRKLFLYSGARNMFFAAVALGLITLVRPVNLMVVAAVPFLAGSWYRLQHGMVLIFRRPVSFLMAGILFLSITGLQLGFYKLQTGHWWVWSYGNEGFRFSDPHIYDVLFSWRKGLLIYTPLLWLVVPGIMLLFREGKWPGITFVTMLAVITYIISSWWSWFYGDGYGLRAFVDFFPLLAVPVAFTVSEIVGMKSLIRMPLLLLLPALLLLSIIQNYQYRYRIIHPAEMNFEKYKYVFLKTGAAYRDVIGGDNEYIYPELSKEPVAVWFNNFESTPANWSGAKAVASAHAFSGAMTDEYTSEREWGTNLTLQASDLPYPSAQLFAVVSYMRLQNEPEACNKLFLACAVDDSTGKNISWKGFRANEYPVADTAKWMYTEARFRLPEQLHQGEKLNFYLWNQDKKQFEVDDVRVALFKIK
ncbi:MAG TPA: hypothetical protein VFW78_14320 [Bacteroidia bacterium]|nr:hypothetical protein [Bacteroidia bacterium]